MVPVNNGLINDTLARNYPKMKKHNIWTKKCQALQFYVFVCDINPSRTIIFVYHCYILSLESKLYIMCYKICNTTKEVVQSFGRAPIQCKESFENKVHKVYLIIIT